MAANEQWLKVLETEPRFAKALANRARAIAFYATTLYDKGHEVSLLAAARTLFDAALSRDALWESGDRDTFAPSLTDRRTASRRIWLTWPTTRTSISISSTWELRRKNALTAGGVCRSVVPESTQ